MLFLWLLRKKALASSLMQGDKRTLLGVKSLGDRRREVYDVVSCTVPGLQPGSFHFVAHLLVPALHIHKGKYTSILPQKLRVLQRIKRVYFSFFILSIIIVFRKEKAETLVTGGLKRIFFYLPLFTPLQLPFHKIKRYLYRFTYMREYNLKHLLQYIFLFRY